MLHALLHQKKKQPTTLFLSSSSRPHVHLQRDMYLLSQSSKFFLALLIQRLSIFPLLKQSLVTELSGNKDISAFWTVFGSRDLIHLLVIHYYREILPRAFKIYISIHLHDISCRITHLRFTSVLSISIFPDRFQFSFMVIFPLLLRKSPVQWTDHPTIYMVCLSNSSFEQTICNINLISGIWHSLALSDSLEL